MNKRDSDRSNKSVNVVFPCCRKFYSGTATDLSKNGMLIKSEVWVPMDSTFELLIPFDQEVLRIPVKFVSQVKTGNDYNGMLVELLSHPEKYLELLSRHNFVSES